MVQFTRSINIVADLIAFDEFLNAIIERINRFITGYLNFHWTQYSLSYRDPLRQGPP